MQALDQVASMAAEKPELQPREAAAWSRPKEARVRGLVLPVKAKAGGWLFPLLQALPCLGNERGHILSLGWAPEPCPT